MSSRTIGNAFEKKIKGLFEDRGFVVERANPKLQAIGPGKFRSVSHDFFGCIDLICIHPYKLPTWFVQCTTGQASERRRKIEEISWNHGGHMVQLWKRMPNKRDIKIYTYSIKSLKDPRMIWRDEIYNVKALPEVLFS